MIKTYEDYIEITVEAEREFDDIRRRYKISDRLFNRAHRDGRLSLNGEYVRKSHNLSRGDIIRLVYEDEEEDIIASPADLDILYEDTDLLLVRKDADMATHTDRKYRENTLENIIRAYFDSRSYKRKVRFINRLDRKTEGIIVIAKNPYIDSLMSEMIKENQIRRKYLLIVEGKLEGEGRIDYPIYRPGESIIRTVDERGKSAITLYRVIDHSEGYSLVEAELLTGRTHQIRLHFSHMGHPIVGDPLYGSYGEGSHLYLKSNYIEFIHPILGNKIELYIDDYRRTGFSWKENF